MICNFVQHFVFAISVLIDILVPDIPGSLQTKIRREEYLAKKALEGQDDAGPPPLENHEINEASALRRDANTDLRGNTYTDLSVFLSNDCECDATYSQRSNFCITIVIYIYITFYRYLFLL